MNHYHYYHNFITKYLHLLLGSTYFTVVSRDNCFCQKSMLLTLLSYVIFKLLLTIINTITKSTVTVTYKFILVD